MRTGGVMGYVKATFWILVILVVGGFLHYTLPRNDVVRIVQTEVRRIEAPPNALFWGNSEPSSAQSGNRDVKFVAGVHDGGNPRVYRNEDTGWGWPPYFKFDSADLQARASDSISNTENPRWMVTSYYGIRSNLFSIYPNLLSISPATSPDMRVIPWMRIVIFAALVIGVLLVRMMVRRFWRNRVDPVVREVSEAFDSADDAVDQRLLATQKRFRGRRERLREWWVERVG